ncbi:MAG: hypothetical protein OSJ70_06995 [Bacilli bacterium]|nr:hypothetical protein [Bacilli bacterium]
MEKTDFSNISLDDTGFYSSRYNFHKAFKEYGITNVSQVLDDNLMLEVLTHCRATTRKQLSCFKTLVESEYLEGSIENIGNLDYYPYNEEEAGVYASDLGFIKEDMPAIHKGYRLATMFNQYMYPKFIDVLKNARDSSASPRIRKMVDILLSAYEREKLSKMELSELKEKLVGLTFKRDSINSQIATIEKQIELKNKNQVVGGLGK